MQINYKIADYIRKRRESGKNSFILMGSRRSGKTFGIMQYLLLHSYNQKTISTIAGITADQARAGAYADASQIISGEPALSAYFKILQSPREIRNTWNQSVLSFNSYQGAGETAKGAAGDFLFINEANNFSKQQYFNLAANTREGIFMDYNPVKKFWVDEIYEPDEILKMTWQDNPFLTELQKEYFYTLKRMAERKDATPMDRYLYEVNYLGNYSVIDGEIFNHGNIVLEKTYPHLHHITIFCDPSALRGADWFACTLGGLDDNGDLHIIDTYSINEGGPDKIVEKLTEWERNYDVRKLYIEINGIIGTTFYEQLQKNHPELHAIPWYSRTNKFERITANYYNLTQHCFWLDTPAVAEFLEQVYDFSTKCEHDDNIDSANSLWSAIHFS